MHGNTSASMEQLFSRGYVMSAPAFVNRVLVLGLLLALASVAPAVAQSDELETFRGTTTSALSAEGVELRINVLRWTADEDRGSILSLITPAAGQTAGEGESGCLAGRSPGARPGRMPGRAAPWSSATTAPS